MNGAPRSSGRRSPSVLGVLARGAALVAALVVSVESAASPPRGGNSGKPAGSGATPPPAASGTTGGAGKPAPAAPAPAPPPAAAPRPAGGNAGSGNAAPSRGNAPAPSPSPRSGFSGSESPRSAAPAPSRNAPSPRADRDDGGGARRAERAASGPSNASDSTSAAPATGFPGADRSSGASPSNATGPGESGASPGNGGGTRPPSRTVLPKPSERSFGPYFIRNAELGADPTAEKTRTFESPLRRLSNIPRPVAPRGPLDREDRVVGASPGNAARRASGPAEREAAGPARYGRGAYRNSSRSSVPPSPLTNAGFAGRSGSFGAGARTPVIEPSGSGSAREPGPEGETRKGSGGESPRDPRVYYFGFDESYPNGWSFFYRFCQPLPVVNFAWCGAYDPFFSVYYWYPYYCHGGIYYFYDYPDYCSPDNPLYAYDESYPEPDGEAIDLFGEEAAPPGRLYRSLAPPDDRGETITDYFLRLGDQFFRSGDYDKAVDAFRKAVDADPGSAVAHFALGEALFATGDFAYAAYAIRKGFDLDATWTENPIDRREFYGRPEDWDAQMGALLAHCEKAPFDAPAFLVLGYNRYFTGDAAGATDAFVRVLELNGTDRFAISFLARLDAAGSPTAPRVENE